MKILKNLEIYLNLIDWFWQYIFYYVQWIKLLQNRKTALLYKNFTTEQTRKNYLKKTSIFNINKLEKNVWVHLKKFDDFNFFHHQNFNQQLYINLNVLKWYEFDVIIYHMQNNHDDLLNHTVKKN